MKKIVLLLLLLPYLFASESCSDNSPEEIVPTPSPNPTNQDWTIPVNEVFDGGPGKDGIPSIDRPDFVLAGEVDFLNDDDLVLAIKFGDVVKAYPHRILDRHEIVNDFIGNHALAVTYCPLTGTGIAWNREIPGGETTFGVSGLLYNSNLMPYDRSTNSIWSQQRLDCVNGNLVGTNAETYSLVETSFETFRETYPDALVLSTNTGFGNIYTRYPYGDYKENHERLLFPITTRDDRLPLKERTLGVLFESGAKKVYPFGPNSDEIEFFKDKVSGIDLVVVRSVTKNFIVVFEDRDLDLNIVKNQFPAVLKDKNGITYDILGEATNGENVEKLYMPRQFMGFWFSWGTFYPNIDLSKQ